MSSNISIRHAKKKYGNNTVIPDLSLEIRDGAGEIKDAREVFAARL